MKNLSAIILLCNAAWMTIYLYGQYADNSFKYHPSLIIFPIVFFALAFIIFFTSTLQKNTIKNKEEN